MAKLRPLGSLGSDLLLLRLLASNNFNCAFERSHLRSRAKRATGLSKEGGGWEMTTEEDHTKALMANIYISFSRDVDVDNRREPVLLLCAVD
jgi:hypothetical protein